MRLALATTFAALLLATTASAQVWFPVFEERFDAPATQVRGLKSKWTPAGRPLLNEPPFDEDGQYPWRRFKGNEQPRLELDGLPPHGALTVTFLALAAACENCERMAVTLTENGHAMPCDATAVGGHGWTFSCTAATDREKTRLEWTVSGVAEWDLASVRVAAGAAAKTVDARTNRSGRLREAVIFCRTSGIPSHAFLVLEEEDARSRKTALSAYGFYPEE